MTSFRFLHPLLFLISLGLLPAIACADEPRFETAPQLKASALLQPAMLKSPDYTIREPVVWNGYLFQFEVESRFGLYRVGSRRMLERRVKEIRTMAKLLGEQGGHAYFQSLGKRLVQLPTSLVGAVQNPVDTVAAVPKAINKTFGRLTNLFDRKQGGGSGSALSPDAIRKDLVGSEKRKLAKELGVDPYSTNAKLQQLLDEGANERYAGTLTVSLASYAIPGGAATAVYSTASYRTQITDLLADKTPGELQQRNAGVLRQMGVHRYLADNFLQSKVFLPSFQTAIVQAMSALDGVARRDAILEAALQARDGTHALLQVEQAAALAHFHRTSEPLTWLAAVGGAVVARTRSGGAVVLAPIDGAYWDRDTSQLMRALRASPHMARANRRVLYIKGRATGRFQQAAQDAGILVAGWPAAQRTKR